jgi:hypothetical protein
MAAVWGPFDPLAASASVPIVVELEMLLGPKPHDASEATL